MRRVLICTVGGQADPIVGAVRENAPLELVVFLCSKGPARAASAVTVRRSGRREVAGHCPHCDRDWVESVRVRPLVELAGLREREYLLEGVEDPDDLEEVVACCERIEAELSRRWPRGALRVIANYTGGTKTMALGLGIFALRRAERGWDLQLNRVSPGGRTDLIGVRWGDRPVVQGVSALLAAAAEERARQLARQHDYSGAVAALSTVLAGRYLGKEERRRLLALSARYRLLLLRQRCAWGEALKLAQQSVELEEVYGPRLRLLLRIAAAVESSEEWPDPGLCGLELVDELRDAAARAAERGRWDDAAALSERAALALAWLRLRRLHGWRMPPAGVEVGSAVVAAYELLADRGDALGRFFVEKGQALEELLAARRAPRCGFGLPRVNAEAWRVLGPAWGGWLDAAQEIL